MNWRFHLREFTISTSWMNRLNFTNLATPVHDFYFTNLRFQLHEFTISTSGIHNFHFTNSRFLLHEFKVSAPWIHSFHFTNSRFQLNEIEIVNLWCWNREFVRLIEMPSTGLSYIHIRTNPYVSFSSNVLSILKDISLLSYEIFW
jgi:hypothetical protein